MRRSFCAAMACGSLIWAATSVRAQAPAPSGGSPSVVTSATGEAHFVPDRAAIYVGVQSRATTAAVAGRDNAERQKAIIDAIVALGVNREQISTQNYSVSPETRYDSNGQRAVVTGYVVSNVVRVELRKIDQAGPAIDAALAKGANQINSLEFFSSDPDVARRAALADAVAKARGDAETLARAAGASLGGLIELSNLDGGPRPVFRMDVMSAKAGAAVATPIETGDQIVRASIVGRWGIITPR